jgi:hypothetical protein
MSSLESFELLNAFCCYSRDSVDGIVTRLRTINQGIMFQFPVQARVFFLFSEVPGTNQPPIKWALGTLTLWVKQPRHKTKHCP